VTREPRQTKAERLLASGAVRVHCADGCLIAVVAGDHDSYLVFLDERGKPSCPCPAWRRDCSHAIALSLIAGAAR
jgi:hypothetical protein